MNRRTRRSRAAMMVTVPVVLAVGGFWAVDAARGAGDSVVVTAAAASDAARTSADAARTANEQAKLDSIEQTRPYVYVEVVPGLAGSRSWDVRIRNSGRSAARNLRLEYDSW